MWVVWPIRHFRVKRQCPFQKRNKVDCNKKQKTRKRKLDNFYESRNSYIEKKREFDCLEVYCSRTFWMTLTLQDGYTQTPALLLTTSKAAASHILRTSNIPWGSSLPEWDDGISIDSKGFFQKVATIRFKSSLWSYWVQKTAPWGTTWHNCQR